MVGRIGYGEFSCSGQFSTDPELVGKVTDVVGLYLAPPGERGRALGSWLNLVEVWFGIIDRQAIRRGIFTSVKDLNAKIRQFISGWNNRKHPFVWTKTPEQILTKANPKRTSETRH